MGKTFGDEQLLFVILRKLGSVPLSESRGSLPDIYCNVKYSACDYPYELRLCMRCQLIMQPSDGAAGRKRFVILNKRIFQVVFKKLSFIIALEKISPVIFEYPGIYYM